MKIELEISDVIVEKVVKGIMENFPEASECCSLKCTKWKYEAWLYEFVDEEDRYTIGKKELLNVFPLIFTAKWPKGLTQPPITDLSNWETWNEWLCQCDATDFDAFVQLACLGEVIYG